MYGIDYGMGTTNIDKQTGIRYGVIPCNEVLDAWYNEAEPERYCEGCEYKEDIDCSLCDYCETELIYSLERDGYEATQMDDGDIFITKSPYYTYAQFCSPCAPGACYLLNPLEDRPTNNRCYCFGPEFFDDGKCPYPVFKCDTYEMIYAPNSNDSNG